MGLTSRVAKTINHIRKPTREPESSTQVRRVFRQRFFGSWDFRGRGIRNAGHFEHRARIFLEPQNLGVFG